MEPLVSRLMVRAAPRACSLSSPRISPWGTTASASASQPRLQCCFFSTTDSTRIKEQKKPFDTASAPDSHYSQPAANLSQDITSEEKDHFSRIEEQSKDMQTRSPWMHAGSDVPPVARQRSAGAMTKGKLLTTPSRMLKLILPLSTKDNNKDRKDVEPLALLVHPQQPLSYLERLIQSEIPFIDDKDGKTRPPSVTFRAEDSMDEVIGRDETPAENRKAKEAAEEEAEEDDEALDEGDETMVDGKRSKTGVISGSRREKDKANREESQAADPSHPNFVRWSPSTEIGDFIRDAARGKEFAVDIEGAPEAIYVGVPSFHDRTYYLRMRLRKVSKRISTLADIKQECDDLAHRGAKNVAKLGFSGLVGWWAVVYYLTFQTELGWDVMEPVTYLVGLTGIIGGYMWFLYHNREVSYKSAMHVTMSRRQAHLYHSKGFDLPKWEMLVEEGNRLRREVKLVAEEYDVEWDETADEGDEKVRRALRKERKKKEKDDDKDGKKEKDEEDD